MILDEIVHFKRIEVEQAKRETPLDSLQRRPGYQSYRLPFVQALRSKRRAIIAEVKKASPSKGVIREDFDPTAIATAYESNGAAAISVLTERKYFQGSLSYLAAIRATVGVPLLRKDFVFDPYQIHEARAYGADAVLLIVAMLDDAALVDLIEVATSIELTALVEVHDRPELERAQAAGAGVIGINNRNLQTFSTSLSTTESLMPFVNHGSVVISESGIESMADIERLEAAGVHSFLIGESLMRAPHPGDALSGLLRGGEI